MPDETVFTLLIRKLERLRPLDPADRAALLSLPFRITRAGNNAFLVREGSAPTECCVLLEGYACRHKTTSDGSRQIVSFHIPGDIMDLQHLQLPRADHNIQTITVARIAWVPMDALREVMRTHPNISDAMWRDALIDASIFREWVLNIGRRDAKQRIAHMLCEFVARQQAIGPDGPQRFVLPMSQEQIADATGLTSVHVNRMLHALAADGVIERARREIRIVDWGLMRKAADFDPAYLHQAA